MSVEPLLLTPGPTLVPEDVRAALSAPIEHHRKAPFRAVLEQVEQQLQHVFGTNTHVHLLASSGTGAMEAAVVNLFSPGDKVIVIEGGKFGERWRALAQTYGLEVVPISLKWGKAFNGSTVRDALVQHPEAKAVFATLTETSTGVTYPIQDIRQAMDESDAVLVVDAISGLGAEPFAMDAWGVDVVVSGSQKGFMLPPGLGMVALSERAQQLAAQAELKSYYFDLKRAEAVWEAEGTPFTPAISLIKGLAVSLQRMFAQGLDVFIEGHRQNAEFLRSQLQEMGLELFPDPACASNAVTAVKVPDGIDGTALLKTLEEKQGVILAGGQGHLKGKIFRIATMGAVGREELEIGLAALKTTLSEVAAKQTITQEA